MVVEVVWNEYKLQSVEYEKRKEEQKARVKLVSASKEYIHSSKQARVS